MRRWLALGLCLLAMLLLGAAAAEEVAGKDIAKQCTVTVSDNKRYKALLFDKNYIHCWEGDPGETIRVTAPKGTEVQGIQVSFRNQPVRLTVTCDEETLGVYDWEYYTNYLPFTHPVDHFTVTVDPDAEHSAQINRLRIVSEGQLPDWVQQWQELTEPADLMVIATHPDDELLWFGGMLPTYAGEQKKRVQVVYMVGNTNYRRCELLAGLWACGVRYYPVLGTFPDKSAGSMRATRKEWGETAPEEFLTEVLKKYKPQVIATQDVKGEYGHAHHRVTVEAVLNVVAALNEDSEWAASCQAAYGTMRPAKLYVHLWKENQITFNWREPLDAFDGKTSLEVARAAFREHVSQQKGKYHVLDSGRLNCSLFGLYWSAVGPDEVSEDLFEHLESAPSEV